MRLDISVFFFIFSLLLSFAAAADRYIVTFEDSSVPATVYNKVKKYVTSSLGGTITHEYTIMKGFTVDFDKREPPKLTLAEIAQHALGGNLRYGLHVEKDAYVYTFADS